MVMINVGRADPSSRRGSALVITLLMISIISTVSFSITALAISEFRKSSTLQDSIAAYYAAESGLEHGLLQNRIWRDAEISEEVYQQVRTAETTTLPQSVIPTKETNSGRPQTFRLSGVPGYVEPGGDKGTSWYNLKMFHRGAVIGAVDSNGRPVVDAQKSPRIYRDSALDLNVSGAYELQLAWTPDPETRQSFISGGEALQFGEWYFVEVILSGKTSLSAECDDVRRVLFVVGAHNYFRDDLTLNPPSVLISDCGYKSLRIKPWNMGYMKYSLVLRESSVVADTIKFDSNTGSIQSTGYSGRSKRTLQLQFSRSNKTILESEDFLFVSADENLTL